MPIKREAPEARKLVQAIYKHCFDREPDAANAKGLVEYLVTGKKSVRMILAGFLKSEEFFDKRLRDKKPEDLAEILYRYVLGRPPESAEAKQGAADFIGAHGWPIQVDVMLNSEEYLDKYNDDLLPGAAGKR